MKSSLRVSDRLVPRAGGVGIALLVLLLSVMVAAPSAFAILPGATAGLSGRVLNGSVGMTTPVHACLLGANSSCIATYESASDPVTGRYTFSGLPAGPYRVSADTPAGRWHSPWGRLVTAVAGRQVGVPDLVFVARAPAGQIGGAAFVYDPVQRMDAVLSRSLLRFSVIPVNPQAPKSGRTGWTDAQPWLVDVDPGMYRVRIEFAGNGQAVWRDALVESGKTTVLADVHVPPSPPIPRWPEPRGWYAGAIDVRLGTPSDQWLTTVVWPAFPFLATSSYTATAVPGGRRCTATAYSGRCTITGLIPGAKYRLYSVAKSLYGYTSTRSVLSQAWLAEGPPSPVRAPAVAYARGGVATVRWTAPATPGYPRASAPYRVQITGANNLRYGPERVATAATYRFTGLKPGASYRVRIIGIAGTPGWLYRSAPVALVVRPTM